MLVVGTNLTQDRILRLVEELATTGLVVVPVRTEGELRIGPASVDPRAVATLMESVRTSTSAETP